MGLYIFIGFLLWGQVPARGGLIQGHPDLLQVWQPPWTRRGEQSGCPIIIPVQHLLVDALQPHGLGQLGLVEVVSAQRIPGQRGALAEGRHLGWGVSRGVCAGPSSPGGAPAAVRMAQDLTLRGARPQA